MLILRAKLITETIFGFGPNNVLNQLNSLLLVSSSNAPILIQLTLVQPVLVPILVLRQNLDSSFLLKD